MTDKPLIFISWSGKQSQQIAEALNSFIKTCLPTINTFYSPEIEGGRKWDKEISENLLKASAGIIIITPSNKDKPWILYEAGAMAVTYEDKKVIPLLVDIKKSNIEPPLASLNAVELEQKQLRKLFLELNKNFDCIDPKVCEKFFDTYYKEFESDLSKVTKDEAGNRVERTQEQKIDEILNTVRNIDKKEPKEFTRSLADILGRIYRSDPSEEITFKVNENIYNHWNDLHKNENKIYKKIYRDIQDNLSSEINLENCIQLSKVFQSIHTVPELHNFQSALRKGKVSEAKNWLTKLINYFERPLENDDRRLSKKELILIKDYFHTYLNSL